MADSRGARSTGEIKTAVAAAYVAGTGVVTLTGGANFKTNYSHAEMKEFFRILIEDYLKPVS